MPSGRLTEYKPEYCELAIQAGRDGKTRAWIAAECGVTRQTLDNWEGKFPDFKEALELSMMYAQKWWEDAGQAGLSSRFFNAALYSRSMAARFHRDWRMKVEHGGDQDNPIRNVVEVKLTDDDIDAISERLLGG